MKKKFFFSILFTVFVFVALVGIWNCYEYFRTKNVSEIKEIFIENREQFTSVVHDLKKFNFYWIIDENVMFESEGRLVRTSVGEYTLEIEPEYSDLSKQLCDVIQKNEYIDFILGDLPFEKIVCRKDYIVFVLTGVRSGEIIYSPSGKPTMTHVIEMTEIAPSWFHCIFG